jgi:hypothetical protein
VDGEHVLWFEDSALLEDPEARTNGEPPDPTVVRSYDRRT